MMNLPKSPKQRRFAELYVVLMDATQATIDAGYKVSNRANASKLGHKLVENRRVAAYIAKLMEDRARRTQIDADWVLKQLSVKAVADIADLYDDKGNLKSVHEWPLAWRQGLVSGIDTTELGASRSTKIKTADRTRILELIGKHTKVKAFDDKDDNPLDLNLSIKVKYD